MVMVPVLVVMSGALAFSAFSGSATTNLSATAGNVDFTQNYVGYYLYGSAHPVDPAYGTPTQTTTVIQLTADNFSPGSWVEFNLTFNYTGTVPIMLKEKTTVSGSGIPGGGFANYSTEANEFVYGQQFVGVNGAPGFYYNVTPMPSGVINPGSSAGNISYHVFIGLANTNNDNGMIGATFSLSTMIEITSVP